MHNAYNFHCVEISLHFNTLHNEKSYEHLFIHMDAFIRLIKMIISDLEKPKKIIQEYFFYHYVQIFHKTKYYYSSLILFSKIMLFIISDIHK